VEFGVAFALTAVPPFIHSRRGRLGEQRASRLGRR
jgi:hypothetical protein